MLKESLKPEGELFCKLQMLKHKVPMHCFIVFVLCKKNQCFMQKIASSNLKFEIQLISLIIWVA